MVTLRTEFDRVAHERAVILAESTSAVNNATYMKVMKDFGVRNFTSVNGKSVVRAAYSNATGQVAEILKLVTANYSKAIAARKGTFKNMYENVGTMAIEAVGKSYTVVPGKRYRPSERETGKLFKAITSPNMYRASYDGIDFINTAWLDGQAKQWYRLQFGAGPGVGAGGGRPRRRGVATRVVFFGQDTGMRLKLNQGPSANFYIPPGYFIGDNGQPVARSKTISRQPFMLLNKAQRGNLKTAPKEIWRGGMSLHGIAAQRYLDSGVEVIAKLVPAGNERILSLLAKEAIESGTGTFAKAALTRSELVGIQQLAETGAQMRKLSAQQKAFVSKLRASHYMG